VNNWKTTCTSRIFSIFVICANNRTRWFSARNRFSKISSVWSFPESYIKNKYNPNISITKYNFELIKRTWESERFAPWEALQGQSFAWGGKNRKSCMSTEEQVVKQVVQIQSPELKDEDPLAFWVH
jgi:hypothetical protein